MNGSQVDQDEVDSVSYIRIGVTPRYLTPERHLTKWLTGQGSPDGATERRRSFYLPSLQIRCKWNCTRGRPSQSFTPFYHSDTPYAPLALLDNYPRRTSMRWSDPRPPILSLCLARLGLNTPRLRQHGLGILKPQRQWQQVTSSLDGFCRV